jgi:L-alanine-DL-glutamate epimerase-like enolase superfamily enzyme
MKIASTQSRVVRLPVEEPLAGGPVQADAMREFVTLHMQTDDGIEGIGYTFFGGAITAALHAAVSTLAKLTLGRDPSRIEAILDTLRQEAAIAGPDGIFTLALSAIDIALWDIRGKALGLPVSELLGGFRDRVPAYASGALPRQNTLDQVLRSAEKLVAGGFRQMKMGVALPGDVSPRQEVERVAQVRKVIGPDIMLMCDANQRWNKRQAISIGSRLDELDLGWIEDIIAYDDAEGLADVARALSTPLAAGEYVFNLTSFRPLVQAGSMDVVMADVMRTGGITGWMKVAALAEAFNLPITGHLYPELSVHLVAAVPHGLTLEYMPWSVRLFEETPKVEDGWVQVPQRPGLGLAFDEDRIAFYNDKFK